MVVTAVAEKRATPRSRTLKSGTISFDRAAGIDCVVRNISDEGACLEVTSPLGIPEEFKLVIKPDGLFRECRIMWRSAKRIGVRFI
jgi:hypothetical protein